MPKLVSSVLLILLFVSGYRIAVSQGPAAMGSLEVLGRVRIEGKQEKLERKRFHLFRGGLKENSELVERLKKAEIVSRGCYYTEAKASPQFICWLKKDDCDTPYCRTVTKEDIDEVPEFMTAYQKGIKQFGRTRGSIAQDWLTTNLPPILRIGFYDRRKTLLESLLAGTDPVQTTMTDRVSVKAIFIDIPLFTDAAGESGKDSETFLATNLLPFEIGRKSYLWACEVDLSAGKTSRLILKVPDDDKEIKGCEVIVKDLPVCQTEGCKE